MWQKISIEIFSDAAFEGSNTNRLLVFSLCQKFGLYENRFGDGEKLAEMALDNRIFWHNSRNNLIKNAEKNRKFEKSRKNLEKNRKNRGKNRMNEFGTIQTVHNALKVPK